MDAKQKEPAKAAAEVLPEKTPPRTVLTELKFQLILLEKAVSQKDLKSIQKVSQGVRRFKKVIHAHHLQRIFGAIYPQQQIDLTQRGDFDAQYGEEFDLAKSVLGRLQKVVEVDIYLQTLYLIWLVQHRHIAEAQQFALRTLQTISELNKRYVDPLSSIVYFYLSRSFELAGQLKEIRETLLSGYRNCSLNHDDAGQAVLLNLILRNYLQYNQYEQAHNFVEVTSFPEISAGNEVVRYLYYTGRIKAVRGDYADALQRLNQALRKAPDHTALAFKVEVQKLVCLVELLQGDIPNRDTFADAQFQAPLYPYYLVVSTVIKGNLTYFQEVVHRYEAVFLHDRLYNIIQRLHQIVIKTGLRRVNQAYSRITLADIKEKLNLPESTNEEFIVAKAIRDGTLNAVIDHENQFIVTKERNDLYGTVEPQEAFAKRITYFINVHNQAVKALQYQNPQIEYAEQGNPDELTAEELLNMVDMEGDF